MIKIYLVILMVYTILFTLTAIYATSLLLIAVASIGACISGFGCLLSVCYLIDDYTFDKINKTLENGCDR